MRTASQMSKVGEKNMTEVTTIAEMSTQSTWEDVGGGGGAE